MGGGGSKAASSDTGLNCATPDNGCAVELFTQDDATGSRSLVCGTASMRLPEAPLGSVRVNKIGCAVSLHGRNDATDAPVVLQASRLGQVWTSAQLEVLGTRHARVARTHLNTDLLPPADESGLHRNTILAIGAFVMLVFAVMMSSRSEQDSDVYREMREKSRAAGSTDPLLLASRSPALAATGASVASFRGARRCTLP